MNKNIRKIADIPTKSFVINKGLNIVFILFVNPKGFDDPVVCR